LKVLKLRKIECTDLESEIDKLEIGDPTNREAIVAQKYFPRLFNEQNFSRRNASAANAALDYGYSILLSTVNKEIVANGYLTQLGIHHHNDENQFNLGSDLMECFRPVVDYWVSGQKFNELTPDIKYGLVDMLNVELEYNGKTMLLRNIIPDYVRKCLNYLNNETDSIDIEVNFKDEVPNNAINGHV
ncbi:MAG TPA: type II CRISPR-associated endonuclease Cas1, partial [Candidatus Ligilactobacillus excrementigallinarum]|nr:type II CRISPR-associated endonuclease Cas1 [Candidatus Ligilactobacillus excrementigallinarum]